MEEMKIKDFTIHSKRITVKKEEKTDMEGRMGDTSLSTEGTVGIKGERS